MKPVTLTREQSRQVDRLAMDQYGICGLVLMENAGRGVVDTLCRQGVDGPVVICCGKGNNAGDGFVIARHLELRAVESKVLLWADPAELLGDAAVNFRILEKTDVPIELFDAEVDPGRLARLLCDAAWIVDALLGTGAQGEPRRPLDGVIDALNSAMPPILAVDLPSGLDCDTGKPSRHSIRAAMTCTFLAAKAGFFEPGAEDYTGQLHVLDIGAPHKLIDEVLCRPSE